MPQLSAAGWLAATGASLLLLASIVVVAGRWEAITPEVRFAGLVASLLAGYFAAETLRHRLTTTATALAVLAATITAPVGIAAAATLEQTWPVCVLVGGLLALVATEIQARRWAVPVLRAATVVAAGLAAAGTAVLVSTPVAVVGAFAAVVAYALGAERRSVVLAAAASFVPFLVGLADAGVGVGTLERIGATGPSLGWSAPLASMIGATVIAITAHRRSSLALLTLAAASVLIGGAVGLYRLETSAVVWWSLPAALVLVLLTAEQVGRGTVWQQAARSTVPVVVTPLAFGAAISPVVVLGARLLDDLSGVASDPAWTLPLALSALALVAAAIGRSSRAVVSLVGAGSLALIATGLAVGADLYGWDDVTTLAAIAAGIGCVGVRRGSGWFHAAAALGVVAVGTALAVAGLSADAAALTLIASATAATGVAFLRADVTPVDTAAVSASVLAFLASSQSTPHVQSIVIAATAAQFALYALARRRLGVAALGGVASTVAASSLWWTSGTNDVVISWLRPYGADGSDIAIAASSLALIVAGALLRRVRPADMVVSSWLAYSPGLGMAGTWLLAAQVDLDGMWSTIGGLSVGLVAVAVGGWRRLGAPLVIGTALIVGSVVVSVGSRLAAAPTWLWIAVGGITLLTLAALIERSDRRVIASDPASDKPSIVQQFCREFE